MILADTGIMVTIHNGPNKGKQEQWRVVNNLEEEGLDIMIAFESWCARAEPDTASIDDFCEYVRSKNPGIIICLPKAEADRILQEITDGPLRWKTMQKYNSK